MYIRSVYKISNRVNGRMYIGKTIQNLHSRWRAHVSVASNRKLWHNELYSDIRDFGPETFEMIPLWVGHCKIVAHHKELAFIEFYRNGAPDKIYNSNIQGLSSYLAGVKDHRKNERQQKFDGIEQRILHLISKRKKSLRYWVKKVAMEGDSISHMERAVGMVQKNVIQLHQLEDLLA